MFKYILKLINLNLLHNNIAKIMVNFASPAAEHRLMINISRTPAPNVTELENIMLSLCMCSPVLNRYVPHRCMHSFYTILHKLSLSLSFKGTISCKSIPVALSKEPFHLLLFLELKTPAKRDHSSEAKEKFRHVFGDFKTCLQVSLPHEKQT